MKDHRSIFSRRLSILLSQYSLWHLGLSNDGTATPQVHGVLHVFLVWRRRGHQTHTTQAVYCPFFGITQARRTLSCPDFFAKFVQLKIAHFFEFAPWCFTELAGCTVLFQVIHDGLGTISILQPVNQSLHWLSAPFLWRWRLVMLHDLGDRLEMSHLLFQHCVRCCFPQLLQHCSVHLLACPTAVSSNSSNYPAAAVAAAAAHAKYFWEQYVVQVAVLKIAGK